MKGIGKTSRSSGIWTNTRGIVGAAIGGQQGARIDKGRANALKTLGGAILAFVTIQARGLVGFGTMVATITGYIFLFAIVARTFAMRPSAITHDGRSARNNDGSVIALTGTTRSIVTVRSCRTFVVIGACGTVRLGAMKATIAKV